MIALFLASLVSILSIAIAFQFPRHVDPMELREEAPAGSVLFLLYSGILDSLAIEDWDRALADLREAVRVYAPSDLRFIMERFNELIEEAANDLRQVKVYIDEARSLIEASQFTMARDDVEEAGFLLAGANRTVDGLEVSAMQLGSMLGVSPTPLLEETARLRSLVDGYAFQMWDLLKMIDGYLAEPLMDTVLTIEAGSVEAQLGSGVEVEGFLTTVDGDPLAGRIVGIHFDGARVDDVVTDENGGYSCTLAIPYVYKDRVSLCSSFTPGGLDFGCYSPSSSDKLSIGLVYDKPVLVAEAPASVYPGLSITASGRLTLYGDPLSGFLVRVRGLGQAVETVTEANGTFSTGFDVPPDAPSDVATLAAEASPRKVVGPASATVSVCVVRVPLEVEVEMPGFALPVGCLSVRGWTGVSGESLSGCMVDVRVGEWSSSNVSLKDGSFEVALDIPFSAFTAQYTCIVSVSPREPWITPSMREGSVFILNVFTMCGVSMLAAAVVGGALWRRKRRIGLGSGAAPGMGLEMKATSEQVTARVPAREVKGLAGLYWKAVGVVSGYTGLVMRLSYTIREYLEVVVERLGKAYGPFRHLSLMYERWLYGPHGAGGKESLAERWLKKIVRSLGFES